MRDLRMPWKGPVVSVATSLLALALPASSVLADSPARRQAGQVSPKSSGTPSTRAGPSRTPAQNPMGKPDGAGYFVYEIINTIRAQSEDLCARYGNPTDCLEEAEVCLTMRNSDDNQIRLCLNTVPGEGGGSENKLQKSRLRR